MSRRGPGGRSGCGISTTSTGRSANYTKPLGISRIAVPFLPLQERERMRRKKKEEERKPEPIRPPYIPPLYIPPKVHCLSFDSLSFDPLSFDVAATARSLSSTPLLSFHNHVRYPRYHPQELRPEVPLPGGRRIPGCHHGWNLRMSPPSHQPTPRLLTLLL